MHTWFIRTVRSFAVVVSYGGPRDRAGTIETGTSIGRYRNIRYIQKRVYALDLWARDRQGRHGDGEGGQEGDEENTAITETVLGYALPGGRTL
jgi:hypothetical protein